MSLLIDHEYYVVEFNNIRIPEEVMAWIQVKFGPGDGSRWFIRHNKLYFAKSQDHLMFILTWGDK